MKPKTIVVPVLLVAALTFAGSALAQHRPHGDRGQSGAQANGDRAAERSQPTERRAEAQRQDQGNRDRAVENRQVERRVEAAPQNQGNRDRAVERGQQVERRAEAIRPDRGAGDRAYRQAPRTVIVPRAVAPSVRRYERPGTVIVAPRSYGYRSYGYRQPYAYTFRPRTRIGFGIFVGYPVAYPVYYDPYAYAPPAYTYPVVPPAYPYPAQTPGYPQGGAITAGPGNAAYGGVSFEITPGDATVTVDGNYVGAVEDFYDPSTPLSLPVGRHRVEIRAPGYQPLAFDVDVVPGQVIPYRGDLQPF